jgi:outer membrane biosynthesis protein TonB
VVETHENPSLAWVLLEAMKRWRYEPAMADGGRVAAAVRQTVDFRIKYY